MRLSAVPAWWAWLVLIAVGHRFGAIGTVHARSNVGREFIFAYAENYRPNADPSVIITNMSPLDHEVVTVTVATPVHGVLETVTLRGFRTSAQLTLPREVIPVSPDLEVVPIIVEADDDVTVHALNDAHDKSMDGFVVLPRAALGAEYYVASYTPSLRSQMVIVVTEPSTTVTIHLANTVTYKSRDVPRGNTILIKGEARDAFLLSGRSDLTGTRITSDKPLAVLTGNRCAFIPVGVISCDHLVEMLPPFSQWGTQFVIMPFLGRSTGVVYRVIAGRDNTEVTASSRTVTLNRGDFEEYGVSVAQTDFVQSSKPVQVVQYAKGYSADDVTGDPSMTLVPPMEQSTTSAVLVTYNTTKSFRTVQNYVNVYALCSEMHYSNLTLDGRVIRDIVGEERVRRAGRSKYCAVGLNLSHGTHAIAPAGRGAETFVGLAYGFAEVNSYAWPVGMATDDITCEYERQHGGRVDYDCSKAFFVEETPCNHTFVTMPPCEHDECVPNEYVIFICAGVAAGAIILQNLLLRCVIRKHSLPKKQIPFGQVGIDNEAADVPAPPPTIAVDDPSKTAETASPGFLGVPVPHERRTSREERADRLRRRSRSPSPAPPSYPYPV